MELQRRPLFERVGETFLRFFHGVAEDYRFAKCMRAKQYLMRYDDVYRREWASREIVRRRNKLHDQGVPPDDPRYYGINLGSVMDELPKTPSEGRFEKLLEQRTAEAFPSNVSNSGH